VEYHYPTILRRYLSTFIDGVFVLAVFILTSYIFQHEGEMVTKVRIIIILFMFFVYEPFCTSMFCTLGQKVTGIRVRKIGSYERISILSAYLRITIKLFLGIISFFTIPFSKDRRAIHDFAVGSVVIHEKPFLE
jgi:uncharacterized RDD family membrane protein YckC